MEFFTSERDIEAELKRIGQLNDSELGHVELRAMVKEAQVALKAVNPENSLLSLFTITDRGEYWSWGSFKEYTKNLDQNLRLGDVLMLYIDNLYREAGKTCVN